MVAPSLTLQSAGGRSFRFAPQPPRQFGFVMDWYEWAHKNIFDYYGHGLYVQNMPAVYPFTQKSLDKPVYISKRIAAWWYEMLAEANPQASRADLLRMLLNANEGHKAFTNNTGLGLEYGNRAEYWTGLPSETGATEPIGLQQVGCAGSTYQIIGEATMYGNPVYKIAAINAQGGLPTSYKGNEHLFTIAVSNSRAKNAAGYMANPFPPLYNRDWNSYNRVIIPLLANGRDELYIKRQWVRILPGGAKIPQYPYGMP